MKNWKSYPKNDNYLVCEDGRIYSKRSNKIMKPNRTHDGHDRIDIRGRHIPVSHIVWDTWTNEESFNDLPEGYCIRHINDIPYDNRIDNLMCGTQKDNIADSYRNGHKNIAGGAKTLTIYDKKKCITLTFSPASDFIEYCGHSSMNRCVSRMFTRDWFRERYDVIEYKGYYE